MRSNLQFAEFKINFYLCRADRLAEAPVEGQAGGEADIIFSKAYIDALS